MARWSVPISTLVSKTNGRIDLVVRKSTFDIFARATQMSPVDTGRFKSNWNVDYNRLDTTVTASTAVARADLEVRKALTLPVGGVVYLANSLPYAVRLEHGWSQQAPTGMVRLAAVEWRNKVLSNVRS